MKLKTTLDTLRPFLIAAGGIATSFGYISPGQVTEVVGAVTLIAGVVGELIAGFRERKRNNVMLTDLKDLGVYDGKLDGVVGPVARAAVTKLAEQVGE